MLSIFIISAIVRNKAEGTLSDEHRSMAARCIQSCVINNIDPLTWYYIQVLLGVPALRRSSVQKQYFVCQDEFVLEKYRSEELSLNLHCLSTCLLPRNCLAVQSVLELGK
jgi:hypothetical protein